jgi:TIR domain
MTKQPAHGVPRVYLAHASEDHESLARPLAGRMMEKGIDVWLDEWEIRSGDSLRRKMEEGLSNCTHFLVLLTPNSLGKEWVETEIDAGFVRKVQGKSRFIGVRTGVPMNDLSPFLCTLRCPEVRLDHEDEVARLIADIHGVSRKPERGPGPHYTNTLPKGVSDWSPAAASIAGYLVRVSENGTEFDPVVSVADVAQATGLPDEDVRLGRLELEESGLIERSAEIGSDAFWPTKRLFVDFDRHFLDFDNKRDATTLAHWLVSANADNVDIAELAKHFPEWPARRMNSALNYLEAGNTIKAHSALGQAPWTMSFLRVTDRTRRFVRDQ